MRLLSLILVLAFVGSAHGGVLLQGFYWDAPSDCDNPWWDHLAQQAQEIARTGFSSIWIPPVHKGAAGGYSMGYDPFDDYDIGSKDQRSTYCTHWGSREQLLRSIAVMRTRGLDIYVDNVLGHRSGDDGWGNFRYRNALGEAEGGRFQKYPDHFKGFNSFGRQIDHLHPYVKEPLIQAGDWLMQTLGVQGMRIDYATNVDTEFLKEYLGRGALRSAFVVSEYWSENRDELEDYVSRRMQGRVSAFDFPLWGRLKDMAHGNGYFDLRQLPSAGLASKLPYHAVTFVENHDTDRSYPTTQNKHLAYFYILTTEGYPSVFWKDFYQYGLKDTLKNLIWIHNHLASGDLSWRHTDPDLLVWERHSSPGLLAALNDNQSEQRKIWIQTQWGPFVPLHDYTGHSSDIRTEADGRVEISVPPNSYVAYAPHNVSHTFLRSSTVVEQQFSGADDLDIPGLRQNQWLSVQRIWVQKDSSVEIETYLASAEGELEIQWLNSKGELIFGDRSFIKANKNVLRFQNPDSGWLELQARWKGTESPSQINIVGLPFWFKVRYQGNPEL